MNPEAIQKVLDGSIGLGIIAFNDRDKCECGSCRWNSLIRSRWYCNCHFRHLEKEAHN
jgi:hypothetical protein